MGSIQSLLLWVLVGCCLCFFLNAIASILSDRELPPVLVMGLLITAGVVISILIAMAP